ncbi:hypothetical protein B0T11DRAFT_354110 [Plectosphaerella cucumerina]|uniref:Uncharacterized protein n=1 Tax=Plectosphaerella cucumerina TaxID=40658 RepID=A0A8K0TP04_9PEZI|nr:hypothetical protein B0T11DRAFT_354110 [Plectosphaerella cucumerina]
MANDFSLDMWSDFDFPHFSDTPFPDTSDTAMQPASDGFLQQPLLDFSSPAIGAECYDWDWAGDRQDHQPEGVLPGAVPRDTLNATQQQGLAKVAQTGTGSEAVDASQDVLANVRLDAQSKERTNQRLANIEERLAMIEETLGQWETR